MNKLYDNGEMLLGRKNDIEKYCLKLIIQGDEMLTETAKETLEEIEDYNDSDILCINYDTGMGLEIESWKEIDEVKKI